MEIDEEFKPENLTKNQFFKEEFLAKFDELKNDRKHRRNKAHDKAKKENTSVEFVKDWMDRLNSEGLNNEHKLYRELQNIIAKKSKLPAKTRNIIKAIYSLSLESFTQKIIKVGAYELPDE